MRLHILSDLHLEFAPYSPPKVNCDAVILAGDSHPGTQGVVWAKETFPTRDVIYILGNHEYYGQAMPRHTEKLRALASGTNVHILENDIFIRDDVVFLGCTLWTNFKLLGNPRIAGFIATESMNDYHKIRVSPGYRNLRALDTAGIFIGSLSWLSQQLEAHQGSRVVVITHHAPSPRSLPQGYEDDILSSASASILDDLVEFSQAILWIHGHLHIHQDYTIGSTRILCNPRGYENTNVTGFIPDLIIEV
jgi:hypothetical protein